MIGKKRETIQKEVSSDHKKSKLWIIFPILFILSIGSLGIHFYFQSVEERGTYNDPSDSELVVDSAEGLAPNNVFLFGFFLLIAVGIIGAMSKEEYRRYLVKWVAPRRNRHNLSLEEIFENENRMNIIDYILQHPGIHYNQIKRACELHTGQLRWHLDILLSYGIIRSKPMGQYVLYFPVHMKNPLTEEDIAVVKSERTLQVMNIIRYSPGITASKIAEMTEMKRNSIKYHIDKLIERELIRVKQNGKKKELFFRNEVKLAEDFESFTDKSIFKDTP